MDRPPLVYRMLRQLVRGIVRMFYRRVEVEGREHVPSDRGGLFVAWHPNGLIDPALILATSPHRVVFGARDGLLRWPLVGPIMRALGTVPIYRAQDQEGMSPEERRDANRASLGALADQIASGSFSALFPEGVSHDAPHLAEVRAGAARLFLQAVEQTPAGQPPPVVIPVGLHYEDKDVFRTDVLVEFHPPLAAVAADGDRQQQAQALTKRIEAALVDAVHPTADWALHRLMHRARTLIGAEAAARRGERPAPETIRSRAEGFEQIWAGYQVHHEASPETIDTLRRDLTRYDDGLRTLGLTDADLDRPPRVGSPLVVIGALLQAAAVALLLPPLLALGVIVNVPPYWLLKGVASVASSSEKDTATVKIFGGLVLFPLAWALAGLAAALGVGVGLDLPEAPWAVGLLVAALSAAGGVAVLFYSEVAVGAWRAVRTRVARWRHHHRLGGLRRQRANLHDRFLALADGVPAAQAAA
ncbi:MAG: 1-acyl-sn-glycerol-3-phosphate acyltransferase [Bacteroidota bacterium]